MPLFFFISGFVFNQRNGIAVLKAKQLLVPYVTYFITISYLQHITHPIEDVYTHIVNFLFGGEKLGYYFGVFWFITCLFFTIVIFNEVIKLRFKTLIIGCMYIISWINSYYYSEIDFFWNINVVCFSIVFFYFGYLMKKQKISINRRLIIYSMVIIITFIGLNKTTPLDYVLDMKKQQYNHFLVDILIPLCFIVILLVSSRLIERIPKIGILLITVGRSSLTIMYLHLPIMILFKNYISSNSYFISLICIIIPLVINRLFQQSHLTKTLLLGQIYEKNRV